MSFAEGKILKCGKPFPHKNIRKWTSAEYVHWFRLGGDQEETLSMKSLERMHIFDPGTLVRMFPKEISELLLTFCVRRYL